MHMYLIFLIAAYLQIPEDATVCLGLVSNMSCASTNAQTIFYIVNDTTVPSPALSGFSVSAPIPIGNVTLVTLTVQGTYIGISHILCRILLTNGTFVDSVSYLTVQGILAHECMTSFSPMEVCINVIIKRYSFTYAYGMSGPDNKLNKFW